MERLRERSRQEGRSLNETAVHAIELGLGAGVPDEGWRAFGSLIEEMPSQRYDPHEFRERWARLGPGARGLGEDLDWARGER
jgi:hypothetical protein